MSRTQVPPATKPTRPSPNSIQKPLNPDARRFKIAAGLWAAAVVLFAAYFYRKFYPGALTDADAMDFAQIARNIVGGHGYATSILRPLAVTGFAGPDSSGTAPDVSRPPLYPFALMLAFLLHAKHGSDNIVIGLCMALFLLSVYTVYRLGRTLFPSPPQAWIALLSAGLYGLGGESLGFAVSCLPATLATILVTSLIIALYRAADTQKRPASFGSAVWVGVLLALCYLTQYSLLALALPVALYLFFSRAPGRGWGGIGGGLLGFFVVAGPWLYRNAVVCHGDPFFTLLFYGIMADTPQYPGFSTIYRSVAPQSGPLVYAYTHLPDVLTRDGNGLAFYRDNILQCFNFFLLAGAAASLLWRAPDARFNGLRAAIASGMLLIAVVTAAFQPTVQMLAPFEPFVIVAALGFVFTLIGQQAWEPFLQKTAIWVLALLVTLGGLFQAYAQKSPAKDAISEGLTLLADQGLMSYQAGQSQAVPAVMTESASEVAWRMNLPSVWLPADNSAYEAVSAACGRQNINIQAILLTPQIARFDISDGEGLPWALLMQSPTAGLDNARANQEWPKFPQMVAAHKASVPAQYSQYTPTQYAQGVLANINKQYIGNYGAISDMLAQFSPVATQPESASQNSTVFVKNGENNHG